MQMLKNSTHRTPELSNMFNTKDAAIRPRTGKFQYHSKYKLHYIIGSFPILCTGSKAVSRQVMDKLLQNTLQISVVLVQTVYNTLEQFQLQN